MFGLLYKHYENGRVIDGIVQMQFDYCLFLATQESANCRIYFSNHNDYSSQIENLFLAGYLTIESMGITYDRELENIYDISTFASDDLITTTNDYYKFDIGRFA